MVKVGKVEYEIKGDNSGFKKSVDETEQIAAGGFGKIKAGAVAAWAAVGAAVIAAGKVITNAVKESVALYGEYEQLVGGVEKIFDEADVSGIIKDANNAYKDLNMSANQYLAAINQTGATFAQTMGDQKGYEVARTGMKAIADYASGTGRNIDELNQKFALITRATSSYQSIADQFSGLLPATSAGFLEQAKAAGFLEDSYKSLTEVPIEEYQEAVARMLEKGVTAMGLYGNTAKESATTIQGSANMAKAAWQNLLTGLGDADANIGELVQNCVDSFNALLDNLIPIIENIITALPDVVAGLASALVELAPTILASAGEIITLLVDLIIQSLPLLIDAGLQLIVALIQGLVENAGDLAQAAVEIVTTLVNFLADNIDLIIEAAITLFTSFLTALLEPQNIQKLVEGAIKLVIAIVTGVIKAIPQLLQAAAQLITSLLSALGAAIGQLLAMGQEWITNLAQGIRAKVTDAVNAGHDLAEKVKAKLREKIASFKQIGRDLLEGLKNGITEKVSSIISSVTGAVSDAIAAAKRLLGISSPSKVFAQMGRWVDEGFAEGINADAGKGLRAAVDMVSGAVNGAMNGMSATYANNYAYSTSSTSFSVGKISDAVTIRSEADIDLLMEKMYQRFMTAKRGRGLF